MTTRNGVVGGGVTPFTTRLVTCVQKDILYVSFHSISTDVVNCSCYKPMHFHPLSFMLDI